MSAKLKGATYERDVATRLRALYPDARRGINQLLNDQPLPDVIGTPFWIECKHHKKITVMGAYKYAREKRSQASADYKNLPVLVFTKETSHGEIVSMSVDDLLQILSRTTGEK